MLRSQPALPPFAAPAKPEDDQTRNLRTFQTFISAAQTVASDPLPTFMSTAVNGGFEPIRCPN